MKYSLPPFTQDTSPVTIITYKESKDEETTTKSSSSKVVSDLTEANKHIQTLENEIKSFENSLALGLADGYYLNFIQWVGKDLSKEMSTAATTTSSDSMKDGNVTLTVWDKDMTNMTMLKEKVSCLHVLLPRSIPWKDVIASKSNPIKDQLTAYASSKQTINVSIGTTSSSSTPKFRPQILSWCKAQNILLDIPTTIDVIIQNITESFTNIDEMQSQYELEVHRFTSRLAWRLSNCDLTDIVSVVTVDCGGDGENMDIVKTFGENRE